VSAPAVASSRPIADVCVIGAGLAGGLVAHALARQGRSVVVLEAGPRFNPATRHLLLAELLRSGASPWAGPVERDRFTNAGEIPYPLNDYRVKGVGGTTLHWTAYTPRLHEHDFALQTRYGMAVDWPVTYVELEPFYGDAESALGVSGNVDNPYASFRSTGYAMPAFPPSVGDAALTAACERLGMTTHSVPYARSTTRWEGRSPCRAFGTCASHQICPISAQYTAETHIARAEATGRVEVITGAIARRFELDTGGRIRAVIYGTSATPEAVVSARVFVLAAHAVESARLLLLSASSRHPDGLGNSSGLVGRHLMEHPLWAVHGRLRSSTFPFRIGFHTRETHHFCDHPHRARVGAFRLAFPNQPGPRPEDIARDSGAWGDGLAQEVRETFGRVVSVHGFSEQLPDPAHTVTLDPTVVDGFGDPVPRLTWGLSAYDRAAGRAAMTEAVRILEAAGADDISFPFADRFSFCGHQIGTLRMGDDPDASVVNRQLVCHDVPNLVAVGSSVFPTSSALNPSLTIAALALRAATHIPTIL